MDYVLFQDEIESFGKLKDQGKKNTFRSLFGCTSRESGMLKEQDADGILGLGCLTNSTKFAPNLIEASLREHRVNKNGFSICYSHNGGLLTIGDFNHERHIEGAPEITIRYGLHSEQYSVRLASIQVTHFYFSPANDKIRLTAKKCP